MKVLIRKIFGGLLIVSFISTICMFVMFAMTRNILLLQLAMLGIIITPSFAFATALISQFTDNKE